MNPFRKPHAVKIPTEAIYEHGELLPATYTDSTGYFSVQSIKDTQEIEHLAEGRRIDDYRRLYSGDKLQVTNDGAEGEGIQPAMVQIDGFWYELTHREPWQNGIIPHFKYYCVRKYDG